MKKIVSISFVLLLFLFNCQETKEATESQVSPFNKNVGKLISMEQAERWINRYRQNTKSSKTETAPHLTEATLRELLDPINEKVGVSFHRAIDEDGDYHILVMPVEQGQSQWSNESILDSNNGAFINTQTAQDWADRYKAENPNGIWSHFFGTHVFEESFKRMDLVDAQNDQEKPQLLLFIWRDQFSTGGRSESETLDVYDASFPCPPTCNTI